MKVSVNTLTFINEHYHSAGNAATNGVEDLVTKIGAQLGAVEETIDFGKRFDGVVIVKIVHVADHPNADRLHVCKVDDGHRVQDVERDEEGLVQIVCGAPNVREGMFAAWLPPKTTVPSTINEAEPFVLEARPLRGVVSNGMMASPKELTLGDSHEGILEITKDFDEDIVPGTMFADQFHLKDDVVIDMENKMFTHRPDCFGFLGIAREIEGIYGRPYKSPEWYRMDADLPEATDNVTLPVEVHNEIPELVPRFIALSMRDVQVKPSPVWLQVDLARVGLRSINNIVDYTNYFMLVTGQPLHAYDYDKVKARSAGDHATIVIRNPKPGEKILLLNGKEIEPRAEAMMIATDKELIGVGGVMGGGDTEVDSNTKNIIIECANFDMYSIRRTSMAHGLFTDAVTRYNKGQSPLQNRAVIAKIVDEIFTFAGGKVEGLVDDNHVPAEAMQRGSLYPPVTVTAQFVNERLGFTLSAEEMATLLRNVEFKADVNGEELTVTAPFWRTDIELSEDIVEEVGRLYGYDNLPLELPKRDLTPASKNPALELKSAIRDALSDAGANEVLTYNFVHGNLIDKAGQNREHAFQLSNALSPDLQYYRLSLVPNLLDRVNMNVRAGHSEFALFEMGTVHDTQYMDDDGLPVEFENLGFVYTAAKASKPGAAYYEARTYLDNLAKRLGVVFTYEPLHNHASAADAPFDEARCAVIRLEGSTEGIGVIGELKASVRRQLKLPEKTAAFEFGVNALMGKAHKISAYTPLPRFPNVEQDVCYKVPAGTTYAELYSAVSRQLATAAPEKTHYTLSPLDIYQREDDSDHRQITLRLHIASYERTLTDDEVGKILDEVTGTVAAELHAERI